MNESECRLLGFVVVCWSVGALMMIMCVCGGGGARDCRDDHDWRLAAQLSSGGCSCQGGGGVACVCMYVCFLDVILGVRGHDEMKDAEKLCVCCLAFRPTS